MLLGSLFMPRKIDLGVPDPTVVRRRTGPRWSVAGRYADDVFHVGKSVVGISTVVRTDDKRQLASDQFVGGGVLEMPSVREIPA